MTKQTFKNLFERVRQHDEYWTDAAILDFTEELVRWMSQCGISRRSLASRIGASPAYVTKILRGNANFTLASMTKLARGLGAVVRVHLAAVGTRTRWIDEIPLETTTLVPPLERSERVEVTFEGRPLYFPVEYFPVEARSDEDVEKQEAAEWAVI